MGSNEDHRDHRDDTRSYQTTPVERLNAKQFPTAQPGLPSTSTRGRATDADQKLRESTLSGSGSGGINSIVESMHFGAREATIQELLQRRADDLRQHAQQLEMQASEFEELARNLPQSVSSGARRCVLTMLANTRAIANFFQR